MTQGLRFNEFPLNKGGKEGGPNRDRIAFWGLSCWICESRTDNPQARRDRMKSSQDFIFAPPPEAVKKLNRDDTDSSRF